MRRFVGSGNHFMGAHPPGCGAATLIAGGQRRRYRVAMIWEKPAVKRRAATGVALLMCVALCVYYLATMESNPFYGDEGIYVRKAVGWFLLVHGEIDAPFWRIEAIEVPMLVPYGFGIVASLSGYGESQINKRYDYGRSFAQNQREGRVPDPVLLWRCRAFSVVCASLACVAAMAIAWQLTGPAGGILTFVILGLNPHYMRLAQRALTEGMLGFWLLMGWLASSNLCVVLGRRNPRAAWRWSILVGCIAGLGTASKLTGVFAFVAIAGIGLVDVLLTIRSGSSKTRRHAWRLPAMSWAMAAGVGYFVFVAHSPALWRAPVRGTRLMMSTRKEIARTQQDVLREYALYDMPSRAAAMTARLWHDLGTFASTGISTRLRIGWLDGWVFLAGLVWLLVAERRARIAGDGPRWRAIVVMWIWTAALVLPCGALLMLDWDRYYLPGLIASSVVQGTVLGAACQAIARRVLRGRSTTRAGEPATSAVPQQAADASRSISLG